MKNNEICLNCYAKLVYLLLGSVLLPNCVGTNPGSASDVPFYSVEIVAQESFETDGDSDTLKQQEELAIAVQCYSSPRATGVSVWLNGRVPDKILSDNSNNSGAPWTLSHLYATYLNEPLTGTKSIRLLSDFGEANGEITMPEPTWITSHQPDDTISLLSDLNIEWDGTADWYWLIIESVGTAFQMSNRVLDTIVTGRSFSLLKSSLSATMHNLSIYVRGYNGPNPLLQHHGNIIGSGKGVILGFTERNARTYVILWFDSRV